MDPISPFSTIPTRNKKKTTNHLYIHSFSSSIHHLPQRWYTINQSPVRELGKKEEKMGFQGNPKEEEEKKKSKITQNQTTIPSKKKKRKL